MRDFLRHLSGVCMYVLGGSFLIALVPLKNGTYAEAAALWLQVADLPLLLSAALYGGLSLYGSLRVPGQPSKTLMLGITLPLSTLFALAVVLNFWK